MPRIFPPSRRSRQPDRGWRGRGAAGLRRQGAGRERDRRRARRGLPIHTELGGKKQVRVEDDGEGMEPDDARLSIERHATSKIRHADDLAAILTLGFRGEALPSIASVSHFVLRTRAPRAAERHRDPRERRRRRVDARSRPPPKGPSSKSTISFTTFPRGGNS